MIYKYDGFSKLPHATPFDVHLQWFSDDSPPDDQKKTGLTDNQGEQELSVKFQLLSDQFSKMQEDAKKIQSNFDKKNTEFQKVMKENEELKKQQMDENQRKEYERQQREQEMQNWQKQLELKDFELKKVEINAEKKVPGEIGKMIRGDDIEEYKKNADILMQLIEENIKSEVEKRVNEKLGGNTIPGGGDGNAYPNNPWLKDHFNLTKQGEIYRKDPELAKKMMAAATGK